LAEQLARLVARPLDRSRPLWEVYLVHGLAGKRVAVVTKLHHAAMDGMSTAELASILLDLGPGAQDLPASPPRRPRYEPSRLSMLASVSSDCRPVPLWHCARFPPSLPPRRRPYWVAASWWRWRERRSGAASLRRPT
jgi:hypothetical protein